MGQVHKIDLVYKVIILEQLFKPVCILQWSFINEENQSKMEVIFNNFVVLYSVELIVYVIHAYVHLKYILSRYVLWN